MCAKYRDGPGCLTPRRALPRRLWLLRPRRVPFAPGVGLMLRRTEGGGCSHQEGWWASRVGSRPPRTAPQPVGGEPRHFRSAKMASPPRPLPGDPCAGDEGVAVRGGAPLPRPPGLSWAGSAKGFDGTRDRGQFGGWRVRKNGSAGAAHSVDPYTRGPPLSLSLSAWLGPWDPTGPFHHDSAFVLGFLALQGISRRLS